MKLHEQQKRARVEGLNRIYAELDKRLEVYDTQEIRDAAIAEFTKRLDAKLANLQEGESLFVESVIEIIRASGQVRGGSGSERNMPEYIAWRSAVYERDGYACCECGATGQLNAHHVKQWAHYPALRFDVDNGITLCPACHAKRHPHIGWLNHS